MRTTIDADGDWRTLSEAVCGCGHNAEVWLLDGETYLCGDCRDSAAKHLTDGGIGETLELVALILDGLDQEGRCVNLDHLSSVLRAYRATL